MKSIIKSLVILLLFTACSTNKTVKNVIEVETFDVDMSTYQSMNSINHKFKGISPDEMRRLIDEEGSGIFYIGYDGSSDCQISVINLSDAADEFEETIYYINMNSDIYPLNSYELRWVLMALDEIINSDTGLVVPLVFSVINGEFIAYLEGPSTYDDYYNLIEEYVNY